MPPQILETATQPQPQPRPQPRPRPPPQTKPTPALRTKPVAPPRPKPSPSLQPQQQSPQAASPSTRTPVHPSKQWTPEQSGEPQMKYKTPGVTPQQPQFVTPSNEASPFTARTFRFFKPPTPDTPSSPDPHPYVYDNFENITTSPWPNRRSRSVASQEFEDPTYSATRSSESRSRTYSEWSSIDSTFDDDFDDSIYSSIPPESRYGPPSNSPSHYGSSGPTAAFDNSAYATVSPKSKRESRISQSSSPRSRLPSEDFDWPAPPPPLPAREYLTDAPSQYGSPAPSGRPLSQYPPPPTPYFESGDDASPSSSSSVPQFPTESFKQPAHKLYSGSYERHRTLVKTNSSWDQLGSADPFVGSQNVQLVNKDNFNEIVADKDLAMVLFYDPGIAQSQVTRKYFKKAADGKKYLNQQFAAVNCQVEEDFCAAHDATVLPMYKVFAKGKLMTTVRETTRFTDVDMRKYMDRLLEVTKSPLEINPNSKFKTRSKCYLSKVFGFKK